MTCKARRTMMASHPTATQSWWIFCLPKNSLGGWKEQVNCSIKINIHLWYCIHGYFQHVLLLPLFPSWIRLDKVVFKERFWNWPAENNLKEGGKNKKGANILCNNDLIVEHWIIDEVMANLICRCVTMIYWTLHSKNKLKQSTRHKWFVLL